MNPKRKRWAWWVAIAVIAVVGVFVIHSFVENRKTEREVREAFARVLADCNQMHDTVPVGGTLLFVSCRLPESVEPLIQMGPRAVPVLEGIMEAHDPNSRESEQQCMVANACRLVIAGKNLQRSNRRKDERTGIMTVQYSFEMPWKEPFMWRVRRTIDSLIH